MPSKIIAEAVRRHAFYGSPLTRIMKYLFQIGEEGGIELLWASAGAYSVSGFTDGKYTTIHHISGCEALWMLLQKKAYLWFGEQNQWVT
eukprot:8409188-Lingulodinium_polyedra.AAC.1